MSTATDGSLRGRYRRSRWDVRSDSEPEDRLRGRNERSPEADDTPRGRDKHSRSDAGSEPDDTLRSRYKRSRWDAGSDTEPDDTLPQTSWPSTTGKGWTGKTLRSFEQFFPKLPPELRVRVWSFCVLEPRILELEANPRGDQIITHPEAPPYLQACREARCEGLKTYKLLGPDPVHTAIYSRRMGKWLIDREKLCCCVRIFINFKIDTIIFTSKTFGNYKTVLNLVAKGMPIKHEQILNLGIHFSGSQGRNSFNQDILKCSALQKLYTVFDDYPKDGRFRGIRSPHERLEMTAKDVVFAGYDCLEYSVPDWHADENCMVHDFALLGGHEGRRWSEDEIVPFFDEYLKVDDIITDEDAEKGFEAEIDEAKRLYYHAEDETLDTKQTIQRVSEGTAKALNLMEELKPYGKTYSPPNRYYRRRKTKFGYQRNDLAELLKEMELIRLRADELHVRMRQPVIAFDDSHRGIFYSQVDPKKFDRIKDYINRYVHRRLQYRQRGSTFRYFRSTSWKTFYSPGQDWEFEPFMGDNFKLWGENKKYQQRKEADPHGQAKRQIMSRKSLGRAFTFRKCYTGDDAKQSRQFVAGGIKSAARKKSGKSKLKGTIAVRKARPAAVRDNLVWNE